MLLIKRANEPNKGCWGLPGGKIELGETYTEALIREFKEETGLTVRCGRLVKVFDSIVRDAAGAVRFHYVVLYCLVDSPVGTPKPASDAADISWFDLDSLQSVNTPDRLLGIIEQARNQAAPE